MRHTVDCTACTSFLSWKHFSSLSKRLQGQGAASGFDLASIRTKLQQMVTENRLQHFYPPQRLEQVALSVSQRDVAGLGRRWRLPKEVTPWLVCLSSFGCMLARWRSSKVCALHRNLQLFEAV